MKLKKYKTKFLELWKRPSYIHIMRRAENSDKTKHKIAHRKSKFVMRNTINFD